MPRDGSGVYTKPFPDVVTNTAISSTNYNGSINDLVTDANVARPIVAGGTGATSADAALTALKAEKFGQVVTNYDSHVFLPGSFYSDGSATNEPVDGHAFVGVCAYVDANNMFLEAYDRDDATQPGALWVRQKKAGVWSSWTRLTAGLVAINGTPVANQFATWFNGSTLQGVAITGLVKGNGASAPTAAVAGVDYQAAGNYQPLDTELTALAGLTSAADKAPYFTGAGTAALMDVTAAARTLLDDASTGAMLATLNAAALTQVVRYDAAQSLSASEKAQAQTNIFITPTTQVFTSGSGTYTTPANVKWIEIEMVGGGGGGAGSGTSPGATSAGGNTTFSTLTANGGAGASTFNGGAGGTASGGFVNRDGAAGGNGSGATNTPGGAGGISPYGGAGAAGAAGAGAGKAAIVNSGSGGGGAGCAATVNGGGGGGAGGFVRAMITSPAASYSYAVGGSGAGGAAGTSGAAGASGGAGYIQITEYYG